MPKHTFDFSKLSLKEYRSLLDVSQSEEDGDAIVARVAGLKVTDIEDMPYVKWREFMRDFWQASRETVKAKNSVSESTNT